MIIDAPSIAEDLNQNCHCISVDPAALTQALETGPLTAGLYEQIVSDRPHLFSGYPVFVAGEHIEQMQATVGAVEALAALPAFQDHALAAAPTIARVNRGARGVYYGYDFHLGADGPQLIEINTNAGGALLNDALTRAGRVCCAEVDAVVATVEASEDAVAANVEMFRAEWRHERGDAPLQRIAIVDEDPLKQYLYPEFLMFREMFERAGIQAEIADIRELTFDGKTLACGGRPIDLVYNRSTDFYFTSEHSSTLRKAWESGAVVVTPTPRNYALYADKRHLELFSNSERLAELGLGEHERRVLEQSVPRTVIVNDENVDQLWEDRREWFFKPLGGYGGKAAYRGDKITRKVWGQVERRPYVAQQLVVPSRRTIKIDDIEVPLKLDLRCYVYDGRIHRIAARLYNGQTTNFRTVGGGFAPVYSERTRA
ncbi:MAG: hypothetical protein ACI8TX_001864 [Hyphomicrobiaceae bacterium]|jgi:hypothetical protein